MLVLQEKLRLLKLNTIIFEVSADFELRLMRRFICAFGKSAGTVTLLKKWRETSSNSGAKLSGYGVLSLVFSKKLKGSSVE